MKTYLNLKPSGRDALPEPTPWRLFALRESAARACFDVVAATCQPPSHDLRATVDVLPAGRSRRSADRAHGALLHDEV
jgi:hypothetical protein